jgi:hypothetical protein
LVHLWLVALLKAHVRLRWQAAVMTMSMVIEVAGSHRLACSLGCGGLLSWWWWWSWWVLAVVSG